jgi:ABC-2 type transport system permease protein
MSGFAEVDRTLIWLSARQLLAKRRAWLAIGLSLVPMLVALAFRLLVADARGASGDFLIGLARDLIIGALLPLTAVLFGTTAFGGDIEDGTLLYLLLKPVARWRVVLWKYVVAVVCTVAVMIPAVLLPWFVVRGPDLPIQVPLSLLAGLGVGCALYCAGFLALGAWTRRALVVGLLYVVVVETALSRSLTGVKAISAREFSLAVSQRLLGNSANLVDKPVTSATVWTMGMLMLVVGVGLTLWKVRGYEAAERL